MGVVFVLIEQAERRRPPLAAEEYDDRDTETGADF